MTVTFSLLQQLLLPFEYLFTIDISCYSATCYLLQWLLFFKLYSCFFLSFPFPSLGSPVESLFCSFYVFIVGYFGCAELLEEKKEKKRRESTFSSEKSENRASSSRQPRPCAAAAPFFSSTEQKHSGNHKEFIFKKSQCSACIITQRMSSRQVGTSKTISPSLTEPSKRQSLKENRLHRTRTDVSRRLLFF